MSSGIEEVGYVQWDLFGYLILAWAVVYCVIWKGLHNSGKVRLLDHIYNRLRKPRYYTCATYRSQAANTPLCMFHNFNVAVT